MMPEQCENGDAIIVRMYRDEGMSFRAIEKALNVGDRAIRRVLIANDVPIRPPTWQRPGARELRRRNDDQVRAVAEMLSDLMPGSWRIEAKNPSITSEEIMRAVCPYARMTIWLADGDYIDGATFCALHCQTGACQTAPSRIREEAFRGYVARRIREAAVIAKQDSRVKERRARMELAGEVMWNDTQEGVR